jgi:hypothetical protein
MSGGGGEGGDTYHCCLDIVAVIQHRLCAWFADCFVSSKVDDRVKLGPREDGAEGDLISQVDPVEYDSFGLVRDSCYPGKALFIGVRQIIYNRHMPARFHKKNNGVGSDVACAAGD